MTVDELIRLDNDDESIERSLAWSPDGEHIAFSSNRDGNEELYLMNRDGSDMHRITNNATEDFFPAWSPEGDRIAFVSYESDYSVIYTYDISSAKLTPVALGRHIIGPISWRP